MTRRWLVLADDLTGAADCAIALGRRGLAAVVIWGDIRSARSRQEPILAYDTASRGLSADAAAARHRDVLASQRGSGRLLFKKIDFTLRGQPAAEIAATLNVWDRDRVRHLECLQLPFRRPVARRGAVASWSMVVTLEETDLWRRDHTYPNADLVDVLATAGVRSEKVTLAAVRNGELKTILARLSQRRRRCRYLRRGNRARPAPDRRGGPVWVASERLHRQCRSGACARSPRRRRER